MTHRPYTLPAWQAAAARDGRVSLMVVPLKPQPKFEYRTWETNLPFAPGDLIWCREDWCDTEDYGLMYKSSSGFVFNWCSPVTMPKWAARTWLRCTGVEVRRVRTLRVQEVRRIGLVPEDEPDMNEHIRDFAANPWAAFVTIEKISKEDV
jgi:hypothetical protein